MQDADDPYLWLEDVTGDEALSWVHERNGESLGTLADGERFTALRDGLRAVLDSDDRIPYTRRRGDLLYNFWQDADHPRGLWRRTTLESYRTGDPDWELLLDVDALATDEDENWVWAGAARTLAGLHPRARAALPRRRRRHGRPRVRPGDQAVPERRGGRLRPARGQEPDLAGSTPTPCSSGPTSAPAR